MEGELIDLAVKGIGAALKGTIESYINRYLPMLTGWSGLLAGALLYMYGDRVHEKVKVFGEGVLIAAIGQLFSRYVPAFAAPAPAASARPAAAAARAFAGV